MRFKDFDSPQSYRMTKEFVDIELSRTSNIAVSDMLFEKNKKYLAPWEIEVDFTKRHYQYDVFAEGTLVGQVVLHSFSDDNSCHISYWVDEYKQGRGISTRAVRMVCDHAFASYNIGAVIAAIQPSNTRSMSVAFKAGFRPDRFESNFAIVAGFPRDHIIFIKRETV